MMRKLLLAACVLALPAVALSQTGVSRKISKEEIAAAIEERGSVDKSLEGFKDIFLSGSSDKAFESGIYISGPAHIAVPGPDGYGSDEFMYFLSGEATFTEADGTKTTVRAGEGMTVPKGWSGRLDTEGYTKLYVGYSGAKSP